MKSKAAKIVLSTVSSIVVLFVVVIAETLIAGKILGTTKDASGAEKINGGVATTITFFVVGIALTVAFGVWLYKFLSNYKITKASE